MGKIVCFVSLVFIAIFFAMAHARADMILLNNTKRGCTDVARTKTTAKPAQNFGKSKASVYLNLAQAIANAETQSQAYRQHSPNSALRSKVIPVSSSSIARPLK
jgi:hypothetical protein